MTDEIRATIFRAMRAAIDDVEIDRGGYGYFNGPAASLYIATRALAQEALKEAERDGE